MVARAGRSRPGGTARPGDGKPGKAHKGGPGRAGLAAGGPGPGAPAGQDAPRWAGTPLPPTPLPAARAVERWERLLWLWGSRFRKAEWGCAGPGASPTLPESQPGPRRQPGGLACPWPARSASRLPVPARGAHPGLGRLGWAPRTGGPRGVPVRLEFGWPCEYGGGAAARMTAGALPSFCLGEARTVREFDYTFGGWSAKSRDDRWERSPEPGPAARAASAGESGRRAGPGSSRAKVCGARSSASRWPPAGRAARRGARPPRGARGTRAKSGNAVARSVFCVASRRTV